MRVVATVLMVVIVGSCSSSKQADGITIATRGESVQPYEIISVGVNGAALTQPTYDARLGGRDVTAVRTGPAELTLIIPGVPAGSAELEITVSGASGHATLSVTAAIDIADPDAIVVPAFSTVRTRLQELAASIPQPDFELAQHALDQAMTAYDGDSAQRKRELASIIATNPALLADPLDSSQVWLLGGNCVEQSGTLVDKTRCIDTGLSIRLAGLVLTVGAALADPLLIVFAIPQIYSLNAWLQRELSAALLQAGDIGLDESNAQFVGPGVIPSGESRLFSLSSEYRSFDASDVGSMYSVPAAIGAAIGRFDQLWEQLFSVADGSVVQSPFELPATASTSITGTVPAQYVSALADPPSGVDLAFSVIGDQLQITATSTLPDPTDVTVRLVYDVPDIGHSVSSATVTIGPATMLDAGVVDAPVDATADGFADAPVDAARDASVDAAPDSALDAGAQCSGGAMTNVTSDEGHALKVFRRTSDNAILLAHYGPGVRDSSFDPTTTRVMTTAGGSVAAAGWAPDPCQESGQIALTEWNPAGHQVIFECGTSYSGPVFSVATGTLFSSFAQGTKGVYGASGAPGWGMIGGIGTGNGRSSHASCGQTSDATTGGIAVCSGPGAPSSFANHLVSYYSTALADTPFVGCNGTGCDGPMCNLQVWVWLR